MEVHLIKKHHLLTPGPTPIPEDVLLEGARSIIHHRTEEFSKIYTEVTEGLKSVFMTEQDVYIMTSTGTGAMEAAVVNILDPGDRVICINSGKFGARWAHICRQYGVAVEEINLEWGDDLPKERLSDILTSNPGTKAVFSTLSETSTGAVYDIQGYSEVTSSTDTVLVVDGISGVGAMPCPMDEWKIDVLIAGSQKLFMIPPGLSYISFSSKAWDLVESSSLPRFYFDMRKYRESLEKRTPPFSPGTTLIRQQKKALEMIQDLTLKKIYRHHRILGEATRKAVRSIGLELLSKYPGNILTAVKTPSGIDGSRLVDLMQNKYKAHIAGAQSPHKGEFFRISHLGYVSGFDIITALTALEMSLVELGFSFETGKAMTTAKNTLQENWE
jgi:aspartate aminotransferase-like enzyme